MGIWHICMSVYHTYAWFLQMPDDPQELGLHMPVRHYVGTKNRAQVLWKSSKYS